MAKSVKSYAVSPTTMARRPLAARARTASIATVLAAESPSAAAAGALSACWCSVVQDSEGQGARARAGRPRDLGVGCGGPRRGAAECHGSARKRRAPRADAVAAVVARPAGFVFMCHITYFHSRGRERVPKLLL